MATLGCAKPIGFASPEPAVCPPPTRSVLCRAPTFGFRADPRSTYGLAMTPDVEGGPGWILRSVDLRPVITDVVAFRRDLEGDPLGRTIELLWSGHPEAALLSLQEHAPTVRVRALAADCRRDLGDAAGAVREYDELVSECAGTAREAVMRQHRGKALLAAGRTAQAVQDFERAVELRSAADPRLLASAEQGLLAARRAAARQGRSDVDSQSRGCDG